MGVGSDILDESQERKEDLVKENESGDESTEGVNQDGKRKKKIVSFNF